MNRTAMLPLLALILLTTTLHSETHVSGRVNGLWTIEGSPYIVENYAYVRNDTSLEIEPGVEVWLGTFEGEWNDQRLDTFRVSGSLRALGSPGRPIRFVRKPGADYGGCVTFDGDNAVCEFVSFDGFVNSNQNSRFDDCLFRRGAGNSGILVNPRAFDPNAARVQFLRCTWDEIALSLDAGMAFISRCTFNDATISLMNRSRATVEECSSRYGRFYVMAGSGTECEISRSTLDGVRAGGITTRMAVDRCLIRQNGLTIADDDGTIVTNNTLIGGGGIVIAYGGNRTASIRNNILYRPVVGIAYTERERQRRYDNIDYNIIFEPNERLLNLREIGEHNPDVDPLLQGGVAFDIRLRHGSPAVDRGDPDLPPDPDGSRSDIGAISFDRALNLPPLLHAPTSITGRIGEVLEIIATVEDDGMFARFEVDDLPDWLRQVNGRLWDDTLRLAGVPDGEAVQAGSIITIRAIDADGAIALAQVRINLWRNVLGEGLRRRLTRAGSPYLISGDAEIEIHDTLVIEPGASLVVGGAEVEDSFTLDVQGVLLLNGSPEANCRLAWIGPGPGYFGIATGEAGSLTGQNAVVEDIGFISGDVTLVSSRLKNTGMRADGENNIRLVECDVYGSMLIGHVSQVERCRIEASSIESTAPVTIIRDSRLVNCDADPVVHIQWQQQSSLIMEGNHFSGNSGGIRAYQSDSILFNDNTFEACRYETALVTLGSPRTIVRGNQFLGNEAEPWQYFDPMPAVLYIPQPDQGRGSAFVDHNLFAGNEGSLVIGNPEYRRMTFDSVAVYQNTFADNEGMIVVRGWQPGIVYNNIVRGCVSPGILTSENAPRIEGYNIFFGNFGRDDAWHGDHSFTRPPGFIGLDPFEYRLSGASGCIDSGWEGLPNDPDDTRSDIGYRPYDHRNNPPEIEEMGRDTLRARPGEELVFVVRVNDEEDDSLYYRWFVDEVLVGSNPTQPITTPNEGGVTVTAYVMDGNDIDTVDWVLQASMDGMGEVLPLPTDYVFNPVFPNPFNSRAVVSFELPWPGEATLGIYDLRGRVAAKLWNGKADAGLTRIAFDAGGLASGSYFIRLEAGGRTFQQRAVVIR